MTTSYRPLANEVGCLSAEIYKEIRRCLRLRGGVVINGVKWIWKTSEELAQRLGVNEKTIRRHLKALVQMGWLRREQHQKKWGMRAYHYTLGDHAPLKVGVIAQLVEPMHGMQGVSGKSAIDTPPSKQSSSSTSQNPLQSGGFGRIEPDILSASINRNTTIKKTPSGQNSLNSQGASRQTEEVPTDGDRRAHNPKVGSSNEQHLLAVRAPSVMVKNGEGRIRTDGLSNQEGGIRSLDTAETTKRPSRRSLYAARALEPATSATNASPIPSHWPDTSGFSEGLLRVCIENARNLAFPGHRNRAQSYGIV